MSHYDESANVEIDESGVRWVLAERSRLAALTGLTPDMVKRSLDTLRKSGVVRLEKRYAHNSNHANWASLAISHRRSGEIAHDPRAESPTDPGEIAQSSIPLDVEDLGKEQNAQPGQIALGSMADPDPTALDRLDPFEAEFNEVWKYYPRKIGRKKAFKAFQARRRDGVTADDLLRATLAYARSRTGEDPTYTKHGATFFGPDEHWRDWLATGDAISEIEKAAKLRQSVFARLRDQYGHELANSDLAAVIDVDGDEVGF